MSVSPSNILSKLDELRKWQEKQQERLLKQHNKHLEQNDFTTAERDFLKSSVGVDVTSEHSINPATSVPKFTEKPSQGKSLAELDDENKINNTTKAKQPFLRRGTGLARFRMTPGEQFKPFIKTNRSSRRTNIRKAPIMHKNEVNGAPEVNKPMVTPLKKPDLSVKPKASWHTVLNGEKSTALVNTDSQYQNLRSTPLKSHGLNDNECYERPGANLNTSDRELLIFEALEQRAVQSSFCSTNSSIVRLLSSTPHKNTPCKTSNDKKNEDDANTFQEHGMQQIYGNGKQFEAVYARQRTADEDIMQVRYTQYDHNKQTPVIQEIIENTVEDNTKTINENAKKFKEIDEYEKKLQSEYLDLIGKAIKFKEFVARDELVSYTSSSSVTSEDLEYESTLRATVNFNDEKKWSDFETCESSSSSPNTSTIWEHQELKRDAETMTENPVGCNPCAVNDQESLKKKLEELEGELKTIRTESVKINKLKSQLEQQRREFERHKKEIVKQVEDERVKINFILEEERKKLAKEKMVFER